MSASKKIKFGFCAPIFANPGMLFFRTPAYKKLDWETLRKTVVQCEKLGYDSVFVADHLFLGTNGDIFECLTTMAALAALTKKIEIAPIHLCNNFRSPGVTAKVLATVSHISNGRVILFYDYGWRKAEFDGYGISFGISDKERIEKMTEGLRIIRGVLAGKKFSFSGKHYKIKNAICNPKPIKKIPIWMGEANHPAMITRIVKYADVFNSMPCSPDAFDKKRILIEAECKKQKRNFKRFRFSLETQILIRKTEGEIERTLKAYKKLIKYNNSKDKDILTQLEATSPHGADFSSPENLRKEFLIGTPEAIREKLDAYKKLGITHFMLWFMDYPSTKGMELFAKEFF